MNKLQENLFGLLVEIDNVCRSNGVEYFLAGGTALGAVRNHCFLPWDDDVDLYITRDNWNKLRAAYERDRTILPENRALVYNENTPYYYNPIPRYVNTDTTAMYKSQVLPAKALGQHIELLIMDPLPNDPDEATEYIKKLKAYTEVLSPYFVVNTNLNQEEFKEHLQLCNEYYSRIDADGRETVIGELEEMFTKYSAQEAEYFIMRWGIQILKYKAADFGKGRLERFENQEFPVGEHAEGIFRIAYGDSWMHIPDKDGQIVHSSKQNLDMPFKRYTDIYLPKIDREELFKIYIDNKKSNLRVYCDRYEMNSMLVKANMLTNATALANEINDRAAIIAKLYNEGDYKGVLQSLSEYFSRQMDSRTRKYNGFVPVSDEVLYYAIMSCIMIGEYWRARQLLNIRIKHNAELTPILNNVGSVIEYLKALSIARYDDNDVNEVERLIETATNECSSIIDVFRAKLWLLESKRDWDAMVSYSDEVLKIYPEDGELLAFKATAMKQLGLDEEANSLFRKAVGLTRNGLLWEKIKIETGYDRISHELEIEE